MVDTSEPQPSPVDQLENIFKLHTFFGLRPFKLVPKDSGRFERITSPFGMVMYIVHGVLFLLSLAFYYHHALTIVGPIAYTTMAVILGKIIQHTILVIYVVIFIGLIQNRSLIREIAEHLTNLESLFTEVSWNHPTVVVRFYVKIFIFLFCFFRLIMIMDHNIKRQFTFMQWFPTHILSNVPYIAIQFSIVSFVLFVLRLKKYYDMLNRVLEEVRKEETSRDVVKIWMQ